MDNNNCVGVPCNKTCVQGYRTVQGCKICECITEVETPSCRVSFMFQEYKKFKIKDVLCKICECITEEGT